MTDEAPAAVFRGGSSLTLGVGVLPTAAQKCLVRAATGPVESIAQALREWRSLVDLSGPIDGGSYRLIPIVYYRLQQADIADPNRGMFKGVYRRSMVENSRVLHAVTPALGALAVAGIDTWLAKGAALVQAGYYPTVASRPMADVDIVVDSAKRDEAVRVLRSLGYVPRLSDREMSTLHAATFFDKSGLEFDLHWHQLHHARSAEADALITRGSRWVDLDGIPVQVPGATGMLIAAMVHGLIPNAEPPVRWIVDVSMILDRDGDTIDWDAVVDFARRLRFARRIERALHLLGETTDHTVPPGTLAALAAIRTSAVERLEKRLLAAPWNTVRGGVLQVLAGYAGGDRELRHVVTQLPQYVSHRWNLAGPHQLPAAGGRRLANWLRPGGP